jgi:hypothetical protein
MKKAHLFLLSALAASVMFIGCAKYGPVVKILDQYNNELSRYWKAFITENGIDAIDDDGDSLLSVAIESNNIELVKAVLKCKIESNRYAQYRTTYVGSGYGVTALGVAVSQSKIDPSIIEALLKNGDSPKTYGENGAVNMDVLSWAVRNHDLDIIGITLPYYTKDMLDYTNVDELTMISYTYLPGYQRGELDESAERIQILKTLYDKGYKPSPIDFNKILEAYIYKIDKSEAGILRPIIDGLIASGKYKNFLASVQDGFYLSHFVEPSSTETVPERILDITPSLLDSGTLDISSTAENGRWSSLYLARRHLFLEVYFGSDSCL